MMDFERRSEYMFGRVDLCAVMTGRRASGGAGRAYTTFACVLNTDSSTGPGKHWVAVFVDCRRRPWTVEYFDSTGRAPGAAVTRWMESRRAQLQQCAPGAVECVPVTRVVHQRSQTECGLYALYYIRSRLEGVPHSAFDRDPGARIRDQAMYEFRRHCFRAG